MDDAMGLAIHLRDLLVGLLGSEERAKPPAGAARKAPPKGSSPEKPASRLTLESPEFVRRLKEVFSARHEVVLGGMHVIGLAKIRQHFGDDWDRVAPRVDQVIRNAIERRLGADDVYASFQESAFILLFPHLSKDMAQMKCALIAQEVAKRVFGEAASPDLVEVATTSIDAKGGFEVDRVAVGELAREIAEGKRGAILHEVRPPGEPAGKPAADPAEPPAASPAEKPEAHAETEIEWRESPSADDPGSDGKRSAEAEELLSRLPPRERKLYSRGPLTFVYRPMWLVRHKVLSAHTCIPARVTSEGTALVGGAALLSSSGNPVNAEYDRGCLEMVAKELEELESEGRSSVMVVPVHFVSLADPHLRARFLETLRATPERFRRRILFEVISIPEGTPQSRLQEAMGALATTGTPTLMRVRLDNKDFNRFLGMHIYAVGADIGNFAAPEAKLIPQLERFVEEASTLGLKTYIHGLRTTSLTSAAVCAGFDYIDGDPVMSVIEDPEANTPFDIETLYRPLLSSLGLGS